MKKNRIDLGQIKENLAAIDREYKPLVASFKPVFGDPEQIRLLKDMSELDKMEREMEVKLEHSKMAFALHEDIVQKKRGIIWLMKEITKKQNG